MTSSLLIPLFIALGAIPGAICRYYFTLWGNQWLGERFPLGTLLVNLSGSFLMGFLATKLHPGMGNLWRDGFIFTGFIGAYTTFSTYILDVSNLLRLHSYGLAFAYGMGSIVGGLMAVEGGMVLAHYGLNF